MLFILNVRVYVGRTVLFCRISSSSVKGLIQKMITIDRVHWYLININVYLSLDLESAAKHFYLYHYYDFAWPPCVAGKASSYIYMISKYEYIT